MLLQYNSWSYGECFWFYSLCLVCGAKTKAVFFRCSLLEDSNVNFSNKNQDRVFYCGFLLCLMKITSILSKNKQTNKIKWNKNKNFPNSEGLLSCSKLGKLFCFGSLFFFFLKKKQLCWMTWVRSNSVIRIPDHFFVNVWAFLPHARMARSKLNGITQEGANPRNLEDCGACL